MSDAALPRVGVVRPDGVHAIAAEAEARVIRHELDRRIGPVAADLRIDGTESAGSWQPLAHASWPAAIDALIEADELFGDSVPPLTALFARTVEPDAAAVRRRMLDHLGLFTDAAFDDAALAQLDDMVPTPTDLWLIVGGAPAVTVSDKAVAGLADTSSETIAALDAAFDRIADRLRSHDAVATNSGRALERANAERDELRTELAALRTELARERSEFGATVDALSAERAATDLGTADA